MAALVPIVIYIYLFGIKYGAVATVVYTALQLLTPTFVHPAQIILDYVIPYMALIMVALVPLISYRVSRAKKKEGDRPIGRVTEWGIYSGMIVFTLIRWISQIFSGILFFEATWWFSVFYNSFGVVDSLIATIALVALFRSQAFVGELNRIKALISTPKVVAIEDHPAVLADGTPPVEGSFSKDTDTEAKDNG